MLEIFPLGGALHYAIRRPYIPYLGWEFGAALCLWIACSVLTGYILAWIVYAAKKRWHKKRNEGERGCNQK